MRSAPLTCAGLIISELLVVDFDALPTGVHLVLRFGGHHLQTRAAQLLSVQSLRAAQSRVSARQVTRGGDTLGRRPSPSEVSVTPSEQRRY